MANTKEFFIKINGINESIEGVSSLRETLDGLSKELEVSSKASKTAAAGSDELSKAQVKIIEYNAEYQRALQSTKAELSARNKEVKDAVNLENAWKTVQEGTLETYRDKQRMLTAIGTILKSTNADTDEEKAKLEELRNQYVQLNDELKEFDSALGNHQRNVGNYTSASQDLKGELADITSKMAELLANGTSKLDPEFQNLAKRAGEIKDAIGDAREEIGRFASDTKVFDDVINLASSATNAFQLWQGVTSMLGVENENLLEVMQRLQSIQAVTEAISNLSTAMQGGTATAKALNLAMKLSGAQMVVNQVNAIKASAAQNGLSLAQKAGAVASRTLGLALKSIPLMLVIGLVLELITNWKGVINWFQKTFPVLKNLNTWFNKTIGVFKGFGAAVIEWCVNPIKTFANVIANVIKGDFSAAVDAAINGFQRQLTGWRDAFTGTYQSTMDGIRAEEERKNTESEHRKTKQQLAEMEIRQRNNKTYSDEYIALKKKYFDEEERLAKGNKDKLNEIALERMKFDAEVEDKITKNRETEGKKRNADAKKNAAELKKQQQEEKKLEEDKRREQEKTQKFMTEIEKSMFEIRRKYSVEKSLNSLKTLSENEKKELENIYNYVREFSLKAGSTIRKVSEEPWENSQDLINKATLLIVNYNHKLKSIVEMQNELKKLDFLKEFKVGLMEINADFVKLFKWDETFDADKKNVEKLEKAVDKAFSAILEKETEMRNLQRESGVKDRTWMLDNLEQAQIYLDTILGEFNMGPVYAEAQKMGEDSLRQLYQWALKVAETVLKTKNDVQATNDQLLADEKKNQESITKVFIDQTKSRINYLNQTLDNEYNELQKTAPKKTATLMDRIFHRKKLKEQEEEYRASWGFRVNHMEDVLKQMDAMWDAHLYFVEQIHGKESAEFAKALEDRYKAYQAYQEKMQQARKASQGENAEKPANLSNESFFGINKNVYNGTVNDKNADADKLYKDMRATYEVLAQNVFDPLYDGFSALLEFQIEEAQEKLEQAEKMHDESVNRLEASQRRVQELNDLIRQSSGAALEQFKAQQTDEMLLLAQREAEEKRLAREREKAEKELQKREKKMKKLELQNDLVSAIANTALGVTKALEWGWPLGAVFAAIVGAMGSVQVGIIAKQMSKLAEGGLLKGKSHAQGGIPVGDTGVEVEGNEFVVNKRSTAKYLPLLDAINAEGNGGKHTIMSAYRTMSKYADGGSLNVQRVSASLDRNSSASILSAIEGIDLKPTVSVVDINREQRKLVQVKQLAGANN